MVFMHTDLLEKAAAARWKNDDPRGAVEGWSETANLARESGYDQRLASVLARLRDVARKSGHGDVAATYASELRQVSDRIAARAAS